MLQISTAPIAVHGAAVFPYSDKLAAEYRLEDRFEEQYDLFRREGDELWLPRRLATAAPHVDLRKDGVVAAYKDLYKPKNPDQGRVVDESRVLLAAGVSHIVQAPTGFGKSHPKGTRVIMFDGTVKCVEDVVVGDRLMGPDSLPRTVVNTHKGYGPIYRITPTKGEPWECNDVHVLSLKRTKYFQKNGSGGGGKWVGGEVVNIGLDEYLTKSANFKHLHKLWRSGFELPAVEVFDPYTVGLYLADGAKSQSLLCCGLDKVEAVQYVLDQHSELRLDDLRVDRGAYYVPSPWITPLRDSLITAANERNIPDAYLRNSRCNRLQLLAGILDGDGSLMAGSVFDLIVKDEHFCRQVLFLCRSLGLAAYASKQIKGIKSRGFSGEYWRITISGDTNEIPTKIPRKQARPRKQKKDHQVTGFTVEYVRDDYYYGIALDGDHLYLLEDCTVTHNTYVGCALAAYVQRRTLVLTTKQDLIKQWREAARNVLGLPDALIGQWHGDVVPTTDHEFVIALVHSVMKGWTRYPKMLFDMFGLVICDEVHRMGADQFSQAMWWLPAKLRVGLSATPYRKDGREVVFRSHIGDVRVVGEQETLIPKVIMEATEWKCPRMTKKVNGKLVMQRVPHKAGRTMHIFKSMAADVRRNIQLVKFVRIAYEKGRDIIVFSDTMDHLKALHALILKSGVPAKDVGWYVGLTADVYTGPAKEREKQREKAKTLRVKMATYKMCSEGTDIPWMDTCVLGAPRSDVNQIVGRIRREYEGKKEPLVYDPVDGDSPVFAAYAQSRIRWYKSLGAKIVMYR